MTDEELVAIVAKAIKRKLTLISDSWAEIAARAAIDGIIQCNGPLVLNNQVTAIEPIAPSTNSMAEPTQVATVAPPSNRQRMALI